MRTYPTDVEYTKNFLGETKLDSLEDTPFEKYTPHDWVLFFIAEHQKRVPNPDDPFLMEELAKILNGTPVIVCIAKWSTGYQEYRCRVSEQPSPKHSRWVDKEILNGTFERTWKNIHF